MYAELLINYVLSHALMCLALAAAVAFFYDRADNAHSSHAGRYFLAILAVVFILLPAGTMMIQNVWIERSEDPTFSVILFAVTVLMNACVMFGFSFVIGWYCRELTNSLR